MGKQINIPIFVTSEKMDITSETEFHEVEAKVKRICNKLKEQGFECDEEQMVTAAWHNFINST